MIKLRWREFNGSKASNKSPYLHTFYLRHCLRQLCTWALLSQGKSMVGGYGECGKHFLPKYCDPLALNSFVSSLESFTGRQNFTCMLTHISPLDLWSREIFHNHFNWSTTVCQVFVDLCFLSALCLFIFLLMTSYIFTGEFSFPTLILETTSVRCLELVANGGRGATDPSQVNQSIPREMCPAEVWR